MAAAWAVARETRVDVLAVREELEHDGTEIETAVEFVEGVGSGWMDGDGWEEFRVAAADGEDVVVGDVERAEVEFLA